MNLPTRHDIIRGASIVGIIALIIAMAFYPRGPTRPAAPDFVHATMYIQFVNNSSGFVLVEISTEPISIIALNPVETLECNPYEKRVTVLQYTTFQAIYVNQTRFVIPMASSLDVYNGFWNITIQEMIEG